MYLFIYWLFFFFFNRIFKKMKFRDNGCTKKTDDKKFIESKISVKHRFTKYSLYAIFILFKVISNYKKNFQQYNITIFP